MCHRIWLATRLLVHNKKTIRKYALPNVAKEGKEKCSPWTYTIAAANTSIRRAQSQGTVSLAIAELALCDCVRIHKGISSLRKFVSCAFDSVFCAWWCGLHSLSDTESFTTGLKGVRDTGFSWKKVCVSFFLNLAPCHRGGVSLRVAFFLIFANAELRARMSLPSTPTKVQMEGLV